MDSLWWEDQEMEVFPSQDHHSHGPGILHLGMLYPNHRELYLRGSVTPRHLLEQQVSEEVLLCLHNSDLHGLSWKSDCAL